MNTLYIEFRDPLFGVIVFFGFIFFIAISSYWWGRFKSKDEHKKLKNFMKQFHMLPTTDDLDEILNSKSISHEAWMIIAQTFNSQAQFEKSIKVYQYILEDKNKTNSKTVMLELGKTYFKAGFLERAKLVFLEILKRHPRSTDALHSLLLIYEQLQEFKNAYEVLEPLGELDHECKDDEIYLKTIQIINNSETSIDEKSQKLLKIYSENRKLTYLIFEYLFRNNSSLAWENLDQSKCEDIVDILWNLQKSKIDEDVVKQNSYLSELYSAKGYVDFSSQSSQFEFDVLIKLPKSVATLQFEFFCKNCKTIYPFSFSRCPSCHGIDTQKPETVLTKDSFEKNLSFQ